MRVSRLRVGKINPSPEPKLLGMDGRYYDNGHLGRVFCHSQNVFYPVDLADLKANS